MTLMARVILYRKCHGKLIREPWSYSHVELMAEEITLFPVKLRTTNRELLCLCFHSSERDFFIH